MPVEPSRSEWLPRRVGDTMVHFERAPCNYCGCDEEEILFDGPDRLLGLPGTFQMVRCLGCGLLRQNPRPTLPSIEAYYPPTYQPFSARLSDVSRWWRRLDRRYGMLKRRRLIERYARGGRLLDVGSATGAFLSDLATTGRWQLTGVEPNAHAAAYAARDHHLEILQGTLADVGLAHESYDVVTMWNVLEHLHTPIDDLRRVSRLLRPGGAFIFSIPNAESLEVRLFGPRWLGWDLPRHLYIFPYAVLRRVLDDLGFTLVERTCLSGGQLSFALSLASLGEGGAKPARLRRLASTFMTSPIGRLTLAPTFYLLGRTRQATIVTYVAQRR